MEKGGKHSLLFLLLYFFLLVVGGGVGCMGIQKRVNTSGYEMETSSRREHKPELHAVIDGV
jgi:hypothetical protein